MRMDENTYWSRFQQSGRVTDYLMYSTAKRQQKNEPKPMQRIEDSSCYKKFY